MHKGSKVITIFVNVGTMKINIIVVEVLNKKDKGWKHGQRNQRPQCKSHFPRIAHDMCHFCIVL